MASNFPTSLDSFTDPISTSPLNSPSHAGQHQNINDAVEKIEVKMGIGSSPASSAVSGSVLTANGSGTTTWSSVPLGLYRVGTKTVTSGANNDLNNVFSSDYHAYRIVISDMRTTSATDIRCRLINSGGTTVTSGYYSSMSYATGGWGSPTAFTFLGQSGGAGTYFYTSHVCDTTSSGLSFDILNPNLAQNTSMTCMGIDPRAGGAPLRMAWGWLNDTTQYTGISIYTTGTWSNCTMTVYGYRL